ncbi:MAG: sigma-70 family RNA polymerase sigma factor [Candidatus Anammoximicrobium sp.]|nr:sigma-70 family RNA polymerase sigma factor [Candidatus Anammoximicrobium sp.]
MSHNSSASVRPSFEPSSVSTTLLERLRTQDPAGWQQFAQLYGPVVYRWCRRSQLQPQDAADVVQDVFAAVLANVGGFRRNRPGDSFRGWLWTICQNKIRDHFHRRRDQAQGGTDAQQRWTQIPDPEWDASDTAPRGDDQAFLTQRVMELARAGVQDRTWQAFWRLTVDGQEVADVARELGMSVPAVYKAKYRVLRQIRNVVHDLPEEI